QKENQRGGLQKLEEELKEAAKELEEKGKKIDEFPQFDTQNAPFLFRAKEPRYPQMEGAAGTYKKRGEETEKMIVGTDGKPDPQNRTYSIFYENDHLPEKQYAHSIMENIAKFTPSSSGGEPDRATDRTAAPPAEQATGKPAVGKLGDSIDYID